MNIYFAMPFLICLNYVQIYNVIINLGHMFSFNNGYIRSKQTDKIYYMYLIIVDISILEFNEHCMRPTR